MARPDRPGRTTEHDISRFLRLTRTAAFYLVTFMVVTAAAIWLALQVAPLQTVSAAGQTAQVGAAVPNFSLSGPGELDLFGQVVPTKPQFTGPIRPLLKLTHITIDGEVAWNGEAGPPGSNRRSATFPHSCD